jgi:Fic family protein
MKTLEQFACKPETVLASTSWYLADLGEARGKQELFTKQSPQKLKVLREHALIESAVSSNRIEGVTVDQARVATVIFGKSVLRDRDEEEVRGYRDALKLLHEQGAKTELITAAISRFAGPFRVSDLQRQCPGVSVDLIRQVLKNLRSSGRVKCLGRGQSAEWQRTAKWK